MSKKYGTIKGKEKKIPERELIYGEFYLIDEERAEKWCKDIYGSRDKYLDYC